jgi:putative transcriptional regulator
MGKIEDILTIRSNNVKPERGKILISEPLLSDYYFKRSVILLAEHNEEGSFGVIMNKPLSVRLNEVVKDFPEFNSEIYLGGPVQSDSLFFIHTLGDKIAGSHEIIDGIYWGGEMEAIKEMIALNMIASEDIRFYIGYSGWNAKQLEGELIKNSWLVSLVNANYLLNTSPALLWKNSLEKLGDEYAHWTSFPSDPSLN